MFYSDDPVWDAARYDAEQERAAAHLPRCSECDNPITDDFAYYINDEWICDDCMTTYYRRAVPE